MNCFFEVLEMEWLPVLLTLHSAISGELCSLSVTSQGLWCISQRRTCRNKVVCHLLSANHDKNPYP